MLPPVFHKRILRISLRLMMGQLTKGEQKLNIKKTVSRISLSSLLLDYLE